MRKSPTKITEELLSNLRTLVEEGKTTKEISKILNIGTTTITKYKKELNISYKKLTAEDRKDEIISLAKEGKTVREICNLLGYKSSTTIKEILNKYNVEGQREREYKELKQKLRDIVPQCISVYEASKKVECSVTTVRKYMKEFNLELKLKYELTDEDINNIKLEELKYPFDTNLKEIPKEDLKEYLENKIRHIIVNTRTYVSHLKLQNYGLDHNLLTNNGIKLSEINAEMGLKSKYGSSLETYFADFCISNNIEFEGQKSFDGCQYKGPLRFDYYLPEYNILIEIQGKQHFEAVNKFGGEEYFEEQQTKDNIKREWCLKNNIKLIEISYKDLYKKDYLNKLLMSFTYS